MCYNQRSKLEAVGGDMEKISVLIMPVLLMIVAIFCHIYCIQCGRNISLYDCDYCKYLIVNIQSL